MRSFSLAKGLATMGHQLTLLASSNQVRLFPKKELLEGVLVIQMPDLLPQRWRHGGLSIIDLVGRLSHITHTRHDIVHGFEHRPCVSITALVHRQRYRVPYVTDWADLWGFDGIGGQRHHFPGRFLALVDDNLERKTLLRADGITVINSYLQKRAQDIGAPADRIRLIPAGANIDLIRPLPKDAMRFKHGLPLDGHILMHIGFAPYDAILLGRTFVEFAKRDPRGWLLVVGRPMKELERIVNENGVEDRVINNGFVPYEQLGEYLACGDVMLLPYTNRTINVGRYPNKIGDYMAAGRPTVTNPTGDLGKMVKDEGVGLLAEESPEAFADAIEILIKDESMREEIGRRARYVAETKFSWALRARELEAFYRDLLGM